MDPKICIVFNGGAVGDFFTMLINEQINSIEIVVDTKGTVINCPGDFKNTCEDFYHNEDAKIFDSNMYKEDNNNLYSWGYQGKILHWDILKSILVKLFSFEYK